jgi:hypothetical protein
MSAAPESATTFDDDFKRNLRWLPWVGACFSNRPQDQKLLIVGESHYAESKEVESREKDSSYTRKVVLRQFEKNRDKKRDNTLRALPRLLGSPSPLDTERLWKDVAFYNFVQRVMKTRKKRPRKSDLETGWVVFADLVQIIQPSHCLFLGVKTAKSFNRLDCSRISILQAVKSTKRIGRSRARSGTIQVFGKPIELCFIQHPGSYFKSESWREYLRDNHRGLLKCLNEEPEAAHP